QREERNERQRRHHQQRHDVARSGNAPISFRKVFVASCEYSSKPNEKWNLRRLPRRHVTQRLTGTRGNDRDSEWHQRQQNDNETVSLQPKQKAVAIAECICHSKSKERKGWDPRVAGTQRIPERIV